MPRYPRFSSPDAIESLMTLPSVSAVVAGGFLAESAPVAAFGTPKDALVYLLLSFDQRSRIAGAVEGNLGRDHTDRVPPDRTRYALLNSRGERGLWYNSENLWVAAAWIREVQGIATRNLYGSNMIFAMAEAALK